MAETAILGAIIIAQFTVLAGMMLYIAQRLERRMDRLEARMDRFEARMDARFEKVDARFEKVDARFEKLEERLRAVEFHVARLVGRVFGGDSGDFAFASADLDGGPTDTPEPAN